MGTYQQGVPIEISDTFTVGGVETDPTTITYTILAPDGIVTTYVWPGAPEIAQIATGEFLLSLSPPSLPGDYHYDVDATGAVVASRAANFTVLANVATPTALDWAVVGPCSPWADSQDVWDCCGQPTTIIGEGSMATECPVDMSQFAMEASQLLYELSGRQFSGICQKTVRPCGTSWCGFQTLSRGHIVNNPGYWNWNGLYWGADWNPCGCRPLSQVLLSGYPVREIVEVKIDGAVVDPATYRLDQRRLLTRMRDPAAPDTVLLWPNCQHLDLDDSQDGTFSVTYSYGMDPPILGIHAAAQLGCELYKACTGGNCALPTGTTRISRQGVVVERLAFTAWAFRSPSVSRSTVPPGWHTGLSLVDSFLSTYNPGGIKRRPVVYAPTTKMRYGRQVGQ